MQCTFKSFEHIHLAVHGKMLGNIVKRQGCLFRFSGGQDPSWGDPWEGTKAKWWWGV